MRPSRKPNLHKRICQTCRQHPYSAVAKEHQAINRVVAGLDEKNRRRFVGLLALQRGLRVNRKRLTKKQDPERDRQMRYIARVRRRFIKTGKPVISIDTKKRELVGNFKNAGGTWRQTPRDVLEYDYPSDADGVAIPFGIYDVARNEGFVVVGTSRQTPEFAVGAIRRWWMPIGRRHYPDQHELLIECDCGNPNGNRCWRWK